MVATPARATVGLIVGEPFGAFGTMMPGGHAGVYLDHVCAETPTHLRPCRAGEYGVVISRYHDLRATNTDWLATPVIPFLYGVDDPENVPARMTAPLEAELRERYRQAHLMQVIPDRSVHGEDASPRYGDWDEAIGAAFDRQLWLYTIDSTAAQDAEILAFLNADPNHRRYTLWGNNCADFAANVMSLILPKKSPAVLRRNVWGDFDLTTPKNLARRMDDFGQRHPELHPHVYEIPQIPGTLRRSRPLRGSAEAFVKTKRYVVTLIVIQPELELADWIVYEKADKWTLGLDARKLLPIDWEQQRLAESAANSSALNSLSSVP